MARQWPWPRWVEVMTSSGRSGQHAPDRRRLLPDREVDEAGDQAVAVEGGHPLLEAADQQHPALHLEQVGVEKAVGARIGLAVTNGVVY